MTLSSLVIFSGVYLAAVATPGPGIAALLARVFAHGLRGVGPFIAGYVAGDLIWLAIAATGLAVIAHEFAPVFVVLKFAGAAYLLYVAWRLVRTPTDMEVGEAPADVTVGARAFLGSLSLTLGNPKVIVFFLSIMPLAINLDSIRLGSFLEIAALCVAILTTTLTTYALAANRARGWLRSTRAAKFVRRTTAGVMAGVAIAVATR